MNSDPAITDLAARARWHLQMGYADGGEAEEHHEPASCWKCGGEGFEVVCMDDLCRGAGCCMHGDGHQMCPECDGEGML